MDNQPPLRLAEILRLMQSATAPFMVRVVTANRAKKTGGRVRELTNHYLAGHRPGSPARSAAPAAAPTAAPSAPAAPAAGTEPVRKNPNHAANATRNLVDAATNATTKVHIHLITAFNGRPVVV